MTEGRWFDGVSGVGNRVWVQAQGGMLSFGERSVSTAGLPKPLRDGQGQRQWRIPGHGVLVFDDAAAFDAWADANGFSLSRIDRWQRSAGLSVAAAVLGLLLLALAWRLGAPQVADWFVDRVPASQEAALGGEVMALLDRQLLQPSALTEAEQAVWRERLAATLLRARERGLPTPARVELHFRKGSRLMGPNAFALPGGDVCITDELLALVGDEPDAVLTVLGHEVGHVQHRHGLRLAARAAATSMLASIWLGEYSTLLSGLPVLLTTASYSRDHELQADFYAKQLMRAAGRDPGRIEVFFSRVRAQTGQADESPLGIAFSSHPADTERVRRFQSP